MVAKDQPDRLLVIAQWRAPLDTFVLEVRAVASAVWAVLCAYLLLWYAACFS